MPRYWTLEEARAALPDAIDRLSELQRLVRDARAGETRAGVAQTQPARSPSLNGHGSHRATLTPEQRAQALLSWFQDQGIQVKDVEMGLIDFPYLRGTGAGTATGAGEEVLLCYRLGESAIGFWHDLQHGYTARRPISEL